MSTIPQVAQTMQTILTTFADAAARKTGFVQRSSKMTGAAFVQTLVFGWMADPQATLEALAQTAATVGVQISPQGLDDRFSATAAAFLLQVLQAAVQEMIAAEPATIPLLQRFQGVYITDSSTITLPDALAEAWAGCGGDPVPGTPAALKLQVGLEMNTGALRGPLLQSGRDSDCSSPLHTELLPTGALRLTDLGYFALDALATLHRHGVFWITRIRAGTAVYTTDGPRFDLAHWLAQQGPRVDQAIVVGKAQRLSCRLLAVRVPTQVAEERRRKLRAEARRRGRMVNQERLVLADWTIFITNVPVERLSLGEALILARVRWQIELLFKLWKDHGRIDEWRSQKPWRILCEVYAKLLAMLVQHWLFLVSNWAYPNRSLRKAAQTIQKHALHLASAFGSLKRLCEAITIVQRCLSFGCRINKRKKQPHTYQLLLAAGGLA